LGAAHASRSQWQEGKEIQGSSYQPTKIFSLVTWGIIGLGVILTIYLNGCAALLDYNYKAGLMLLVLWTVAIVYWGLELLAKSPWGRVLKAIREDEEIATALGKNVFWYKLQAFMLGGAIAGIAGAFYAWQLTTIYPSNFETLVTFNVWTMVVLGGAGKNSGALLGAIIFWAYDALTRFYLPKLGWFDSSQEGAFRIMIIGLILMVLMVWRPQGILGKKEELTLSR
jgi:neutral amino acid transport system permease protein